MRLAVVGVTRVDDGELAVTFVDRVQALAGGCDVRGLLDVGLALRSDLGLHDLDVRGKESQSRQSGRADGKALARGGRGVAQRVEHVGALADVGGLTGHLGVAARVVGDRAVRVGRQCDAQRREHADSGDAHAVETHQVALAAARKRERRDDRNDHNKQ